METSEIRKQHIQSFISGIAMNFNQQDEKKSCLCLLTVCFEWKQFTHLSLYSSLWAYDWTLSSSIKNLTRWWNEAVTDGGCLRSRTSTGSLDDKHIMCSAHTGCEQHSLSEQSIMPSRKLRTTKVSVDAEKVERGNWQIN